jgi:phosphonate transport system substrate-binding protein
VASMEPTRDELVFATYLAPSIRPVYEFVVERVAIELGVPTRLVTGESFGAIREAEVDFAFLCGLPYVRLRAEDPASVEAIAAPVIRGERYGGRPIYFSDVIVGSGLDAESLADLQGCSWAYNERDSHSGYLLTLYSLARLGATGNFFSSAQVTGFHQESIRRVAAELVQASAVDSQVLAVALRDDPELAGLIRVIDVLGPSTIQPLVAVGGVPGALRQDVTRVVAAMGNLEEDRRALAAGLVDRFVPVVDESYDDIRAMLDVVERAGLGF